MRNANTFYNIHTIYGTFIGEEKLTIRIMGYWQVLCSVCVRCFVAGEGRKEAREEQNLKETCIWCVSNCVFVCMV